MRYIKGRWIPAPKGKKRNHARPIFCFLFALLLVYAVISEISLSFITQELTEEATQQHLSRSVADAIEDMLVDSKKTAELTVISKDNEGKIVSIQANTQEMNLFKAKLTKQIIKKLNGTTRICVPIGSFTNISVLNGRGFSIPLKLNFESSVDIEFESELVSAGINQSCHRIYLTVSAQTVSQSRKFSVKEPYETKFILSETVIVGEVPQLMLDGR